MTETELSDKAQLIIGWLRANQASRFTGFDLEHLFYGSKVNWQRRRQIIVAACTELVTFGLLIEAPTSRSQSRFNAGYWTHPDVYRDVS